MSDDEKLPILGSASSLGPVASTDGTDPDQVETKVYRRRWWVLGVFVLTSCAQSMVWNTWGPITESAKAIFGWSDSTIGLIVNLGNISFITFVMPMSWINDEKGLRVSMLISTTCLVTFTGLRCITLEPTPLRCFSIMLMGKRELVSLLGLSSWCLVMVVWLFFTVPQVCLQIFVIGPCFLCGVFLSCLAIILLRKMKLTSFIKMFASINSAATAISGSVAFAAPALMSNTWFPPEQRATATAIGTFFVFMGVGMSFILGPNVVHSPEYAYYNETIQNETTDRPDVFLPLETTTQVYKNVTNMAEMKADIKHLLFIHLGIAALCFLCVVIYFPRKPPLPPSKTASIERIEYKKGFKQLLRNRPAWLVVIANSLPIGVIGVWGPVLGVNMDSLDVSQTDAGWMGFWMTLSGCGSGLLLARFNDLLKRRMKLYLILLLVGGAGSSVWFTLLCSKYISFNLASLYAASVIAGTFINATIPLFFELSCEASYPVAEGLTGAFLTFFQNLVGIFFLSLLFISSIGKSWMNWALVVSCVLALPLVCIFPENYRRTNIDVKVDVKDDVTINVNSNVTRSSTELLEDSEGGEINNKTHLSTQSDKSYSPYNL